jgi:hypothetical protein
LIGDWLVSGPRRGAFGRGGASLRCWPTRSEGELAAVYRYGSFKEAAFTVVRLFEPKCASSVKKLGTGDFKTRLQNSRQATPFTDAFRRSPK